MNPSKASDMGLIRATLVPALATALAFVPRFLTLPDETVPFWPIVGAAPLAALLVNLLWPAASTGARAMKTGLPQLLLFPLLFYIDILIDDRRGYYHGGDLDFDRRFQTFLGTVAGFISGIVVMALVALCAVFGTGLRAAAVSVDSESAGRQHL